MVLTLKKSFVDKIRQDQSLMIKLAELNDRRFSTIEAWLKGKPGWIMLTTAANLKVLKDHFQLLEVGELLENQIVEA